MFPEIIKMDMSSKEYISESDKDNYFDIKRFVYRNFIQIFSIIIVLVLLVIGRDVLPLEILIGGALLSISYLIVIISIEFSKKRFRKSIKKKKKSN